MDEGGDIDIHVLNTRKCMSILSFIGESFNLLCGMGDPIVTSINGATGLWKFFARATRSRAQPFRTGSGRGGRISWPHGCASMICLAVKRTGTARDRSERSIEKVAETFRWSRVYASNKPGRKPTTADESERVPMEEDDANALPDASDSLYGSKFKTRCGNRIESRPPPASARSRALSALRTHGVRMEGQGLSLGRPQ